MKVKMRVSLVPPRWKRWRDAIQAWWPASFRPMADLELSNHFIGKSWQGDG